MHTHLNFKFKPALDSNSLVKKLLLKPMHLLVSNVQLVKHLLLLAIQMGKTALP